MRRLAVYCGSRSGHAPEHGQTATALGRAMARRGVGLVYGAAQIGLMGTIADAVLAADGEVIGVIPEALMDAEVAHHQLTRLEVVADMHVRKARMIELADAMVALPGGLEPWRNCSKHSPGCSCAFTANPVPCSMWPAITTISSSSWMGRWPMALWRRSIAGC